MFTCVAPLSVSAASNENTNYSKFDRPETKGDYAYYSGGKTKKSNSTSKSEIKWMQAALNYCIKYEGLKTAYISVDGSFGPATRQATLAFQKAANLTQDGSFGPSTIKKMISVLSDNKKSFNSTATTQKKPNLSSKCNVVKTYKLENKKYYMATLKVGYNGVKKGSTIFLDSNYTAVTDTQTLDKLLFTNTVDVLAQKSNGFANLIHSYKVVNELNAVCQDIIEAQLTQKFIGSASGSFASIMLSSNPKSLISASSYLTEECYITFMTAIYLDGITTTALSNCNLVKKYCKDGVSSYEEALAIKNALINARAVFLVAGTDCMAGLINGYTNKTAATLNSLKTYFSAMGNTLLGTYGGKLSKVIDTCSKGQTVLSELDKIYSYNNCQKEAQKTFTNMFNGSANKSITAVSTTQKQLAK